MPREIGRRRRRQDPDEDYGPASDTGATPDRRRRSSTEEEGESTQRRARGSATHAEEPPRRARSRTAPSHSASSSRGWGAYNKVRSTFSNFPDQFKPGDDTVLIKFLEGEPFLVYSRHWVKEISEGRRSFTCLGDGCPLCDEIGHQPALQVLFNVVDYSDPEHAEMKVWAVGARLAQTIEQFASDPKIGSIDREDLFWSVTRTGSGTKTQYSLVPVKERDLADDWDMDADDVYDQLERLLETGTLHDETVLKIDSRDDLRDVVDDLS